MTPTPDVPLGVAPVEALVPAEGGATGAPALPELAAPAGGGRAAVLALAGLAYAAASLWLMTGAAASPWNPVGVLLPMFAGAAYGTWQAGQRGRSALAMVLGAALVLQAATGVDVPAARLYLAQHVAVHLLLAFGFASTLRRGAKPLITALAERLHEDFTPAMARYTRHVTAAWVVYFVGAAAASVVLYAAAPPAWWAVFANVGTPVGVAVMFVGEWLLRYRLHPEFHRSTLRDAMRAYRQFRAAEPPRKPLA